MGGGGGMSNGVTLELSLYYRDDASNAVTVAATNFAHTPAVFSNRTHLVDFQVHTPVVKPGDPWAERRLGVRLLSTVNRELAGGYWDLDNVRLSSVGPPAWLRPWVTNGSVQLTLQGEPGARFEILAATQIDTPVSSWTSLAELTNLTGAVSFIDRTTNTPGRFYRARELP
jgi:hypothetical protein